MKADDLLDLMKSKVRTPELNSSMQSEEVLKFKKQPN